MRVGTLPGWRSAAGEHKRAAAAALLRVERPCVVPRHRPLPRVPQTGELGTSAGPRCYGLFRQHQQQRKQQLRQPQAAQRQHGSSSSPAPPALASGTPIGRATPPPSLADRLRAALPQWRAIGASPQVLQWIREGVRPTWINRRPPAPFFIKGAALTDEQRPHWAALREEYLASGAIQPATARTHVSPAFLVPKATGGWRLIVDLRRLNKSCVPYRCRFETLRVLNRLACQGDWMFSFDLKDGYHCISIEPSFRKYFTFCLDGQYYQAAALPMGWRNAPFVFTKVMRPMVAYLRAPAARGQPSGQPLQPVKTGPWERRTVGIRVLPYLDDFLCLARTRQDAEGATAFVQRTLHSLGLQWHPRKCHWRPCQSLPHLGLTVDTARGVFVVTPQRQQRIRAAAKELLCESARSRRAIPARRLAQFAGLAVSTALAVPSARFHLRELYDVISTRQVWGGRVRITHQAIRDLEWWLDLPVRAAQRSIWRSPASATLHSDSSGYGWGAVLNGTVPARGFWSADQQQQHITWKELVAVRLGVESFLPRLAGRAVRLFEDNMGVVGILRGLSSRSRPLMAELRRLWALLDSQDIELRVQYIRSADNEYADRLSRLPQQDDWQLSPAIFQQFDASWGPHTTDCFAAYLNRQVPRYFSEYLDPRSAGVDAFMRDLEDWHGHVNWCNPPWGLLSQLVQHLRLSGAAATVVAPYWTAQPWFGPLLDLASEYRVLEPARDIFRPGHLGSTRAIGPPRWRVLVCRIPLRPPGTPS